MEVNDQSSLKLFEERAKLHQDVNSVLDAGFDDKAKHSNVLHDYFSKKYIESYSNLKKTDVVLDFGCGVGRLSNHVLPKVQKVIGYDASESMLQIAKNSSPEAILYVNEIEKVVPDSLDVVISHWVLAHISDEKIIDVFTKIRSQLKSGGKICIYEQTPASEAHLFANEVYRRRTIQEYEILFSKIGFELVVSKHVYRTPSYARSIWNKLKSDSTWALPFLYLIERYTLEFRAQHVEYYTTFMEFKKKSWK